MIDRWNGVVRKHDTVYHLGDFCFGLRWIELAGRLNGHKFLILGNHDIHPSEKYLEHFNRLMGAHQFDSFILTHIPVYPSQLKSKANPEGRFWANIHGHYHSRPTHTEARYLNVSCERIDLTPIPLEEVISQIQEAENPEFV